MSDTGRKRAGIVGVIAAVAVMGLTGTASAQEETCVGPIDPTTEPGVGVPEICIWLYTSQSETEPNSLGIRIDGVGSVSINDYPITINVPNVEPPPGESTVTVTVYDVASLQVHFFPSTEDLLLHNGVCVSVDVGAREHSVCTRDHLG